MNKPGARGAVFGTVKSARRQPPLALASRGRGELRCPPRGLAYISASPARRSASERIGCPGTIKAAARGARPGAGPWGQGPSGPPAGDIEEIIRRVQEALGQLAPGRRRRRAGRLQRRATICSSFSRRSCLVRLGHVLHRPAQRGRHQPGARPLHRQDRGRPQHNWPWPIGSVIKVPVWDQQITEVGYRSRRRSDVRRRARCSPATRTSSTCIFG